MMNMTTKVAFELTKEGKVTIEVRGNKVAVKAGIMVIVERVAEIEEVSMEEFIAEMQRANEFAKKDPGEIPGEIFAEILSKLFGDDEEPEGYDGDCDNCDRHEKMPEEMKEFFDKMFGGLN